MDQEEAKKLAYKRLAMRGFHSSEMRGLLEERGASKQVVNTVVEELLQLGYLNDIEWIKGAIRSYSLRKYGAKAIAYKLSTRGIPKSEFLPFLAEIQEQQPDQIRRLLQTTYKNRNLSLYREKQKVIAALVRKGYDLNVILSVIKTGDEEEYSF